jgi:hypothetical protein
MPRNDVFVVTILVTTKLENLKPFKHLHCDKRFERRHNLQACP